MRGKPAQRPNLPPEFGLVVPDRADTLGPSDPPELEELCDEWLARALDQALRMLDLADAQDVAEYAVARMVINTRKKPRLLTTPDQCDALLYTTTAERVIDVLRRSAARGRLEDDLTLHFADRVAPDPDTIMDATEFQNCVEAVVRRMPARMQLIWKMWLDDVPQVEIAIELRISHKTVAAQLGRAKDRVRTAVERAGFAPNGRKTS